MATWIDGWFDPSSSVSRFLVCVHGWLFIPLPISKSIMERQFYVAKGEKKKARYLKDKRRRKLPAHILGGAGGGAGNVYMLPNKKG